MYLPFRPLRLGPGAAPAPAPPPGPPPAGTVLRLASFGDSRADFKGGGTTGPNLNDASSSVPSQGFALTNTPSCACVEMFLDDAEYVANGGASGEGTDSWNSGSRLGGRTFSAILALSPNIVTIQYGTNNLINGPGGSPGVTNSTNMVTVSDRIISDTMALINAFLAAGVKVVWETIYQRTPAGYANTATADRRDACDRANTQLIAQIQAHPQFGTNLEISDVRAILNEGGALTGAYLDATGTDNTHLHRAKALRVGKVTAAAIRRLSASSGLQPLIGCSGPNLVHAVDATTVLGISRTAMSPVSTTYGSDAFGSYVELVNDITGSGSVMSFQIHANVGSSGGATPVNTVSAGQAVKGRVLILLDDGNGAVPPVNNLYVYRYTSYAGGSPGLQTVQQGAAGAGSVQFAEMQDRGIYLLQPQVLSGGSSQIVAPLAGAGMRYQVGVYGHGSSGRVRVRAYPEMRIFG